MATSESDPVPSSRMLDLGPIAQALSLDGVVEEVLGRFGPGAALYAIDHDFSSMNDVGRNLDAVDLDGELRQAMLSGRPHFDGRRSWIPLPERNEAVFVVAMEGSVVPIPSDRAVLGALLDGHRRRFEDLERRRRRRGMSVAAELQWDALPMRADAFGDFEVAGVLEPAYEIAGDVFDFAMVDGAVWAYSFDGMGHGMEATISSTIVLAAVRNVRREGGSLGEQMQSANSVLFDHYGGDRFVTGAACRIAPDGAVGIVNAGHEPIRTVIGGRVEQLELDVDLPLGVEPATVFRTQDALALGPGDGFVMFSDGPAGQVHDGRSFGADRMNEALRSHWSSAPLETGHGVLGDVIAFLDGARVDDDLTAVVVRRRSDAGSPS